MFRRNWVFKMDITSFQRFHFLIVPKLNHDPARSEQKISFNIPTLADKFHGVQPRRISKSLCNILETENIITCSTTGWEMLKIPNFAQPFNLVIKYCLQKMHQKNSYVEIVPTPKTCPQGNIWFVWSKTSYGGEKVGCDAGGRRTDKRNVKMGLEFCSQDLQ